MSKETLHLLLRMNHDRLETQIALQCAPLLTGVKTVSYTHLDVYKRQAPINVLELFIRPLSLCMRLFGNVLGAIVVMALIKHLVPLVVPLPFSFYFDIFDGVIPVSYTHLDVYKRQGGYPFLSIVSFMYSNISCCLEVILS